MNSKLTLILTVMFVLLTIMGCTDESTQTGEPASTAQIIGRVGDNKTNFSLSNATIILTSTITVDSVVSQPDGSFNFSIDLSPTSSSFLSGTITIRKAGYKSNSFPVFVNAGSVLQRDFLLERDTTTTIGGGGTTGGTAHSLAFISLSTQQISVVGVGGTESAIVVFEVRDSLGFPINIDHQDTVNFSINGTPLTGPPANRAYVSPPSALTNASGRVATTVNSGITSGVIQFVASLRRNDGIVIQSTPVIITVNAGLPEQTHFSIGIERFNFAALHWLGRSDLVTVLVGDRYSNPVKLATAVYFNTTGGVVDASAFTNADGFGTVSLFSGNPDPSDPTLFPPSSYGNGTGYARVRAFTIGEGSVPVKDSMTVLFSGYATISAASYFVNIDSSTSGRCVTVPITIADENGNPLASGTSVTTTAIFSPPENTNWSVNATGLPTDPFDDFITRGPGRTNFTLRICDGTPGGVLYPMPFTVEIKVDGPNGRTAIYIDGVVAP